jgi:hypothetical protein
MGKLWISSQLLPSLRYIILAETFLAKFPPSRVLPSCRTPSMEQTAGLGGLEDCAERAVCVDTVLKLLLGNGLQCANVCL